MSAQIRPPKVHVVVRALDRNCSGLLTGFSLLHRQGRIRFVQEMRTPPPEATSGPWHLRDKDDSNIEIIVDDRASGFVDFHDSWELNEIGLRDHVVYFKRSLDPERHPAAARAKLEPLGLIYEVWDNRFDRFEALRILTHEMAFRRRGRELLRYSAHLLMSWLSRGPRANLSLTSAPPQPDLPPTALFMVGLWDPASIGHHDPYLESQCKAINQMRTSCVRQLKKTLGDKFHGGVQHSAFAKRYAPDALLAKPQDSSKRRYLQTVRRHPVGIATMGLHGSNGCKLAEYVALSRAIVSERLRYSAPGPFAPGSHYLAFDTPEECAHNVQELLESPSLRVKLMRNNWEYYNDWMRPDSMAMRLVNSIRNRT